MSPGSPGGLVHSAPGVWKGPFQTLMGWVEYIHLPQGRQLGRFIVSSDTDPNHQGDGGGGGGQHGGVVWTVGTMGKSRPSQRSARGPGSPDIPFAAVRGSWRCWRVTLGAEAGKESSLNPEQAQLCSNEQAEAVQQQGRKGAAGCGGWGGIGGWQGRELSQTSLSGHPGPHLSLGTPVSVSK